MDGWAATGSPDELYALRPTRLNDRSPMPRAAGRLYLPGWRTCDSAFAAADAMGGRQIIPFEGLLQARPMTIMGSVSGRGGESPVAVQQMQREWKQRRSWAQCSAGHRARLVLLIRVRRHRRCDGEQF